ncbi:hypothetical protein ACTFIW_004253 [Dictyostelium discoideum]
MNIKWRIEPLTLVFCAEDLEKKGIDPFTLWNSDYPKTVFWIKDQIKATARRTKQTRFINLAKITIHQTIELSTSLNKTSQTPLKIQQFTREIPEIFKVEQKKQNENKMKITNNTIIPMQLLVSSP